MRNFLASALLVATACARPVTMAVPQEPTPAADPPGRVARLAFSQGPVSFRAAGTDDWVAAELNRPLTARDDLWADEGARAELDTGDATIRLDSRTGVTLLTLDDRLSQLKVTGGVVQVRLRHLEDNDTFEVATPNAAITLLRAGDYRIEVTSEAQTLVLVRAGSAEVSGAGDAFVVRPGDQVRLTGADTVARDIRPAPPLDPFDDFCRQREERGAKAESRKYVSGNTVGWEDLDEHGLWREYPAWGPVWIPRRVPPGWAPYRFGHWVWIEPWGWTWIDDAPWGFAPFHYGRWVIVDGVWVWIPGPVRVRAVYAPALVVFVGGGGLHWHVRVGVGLGVGWFPLGPHEVWIPPYRASHRYITNINVSHTVIHDTTNIWRVDPARQRYVNHGAQGGITAVDENIFRGGRPVGRGALDIPARQADEYRVRGTAPPVAPDRGSVARHEEGGPRVTRPPENVSQRRVVVREQPSPRAVPFEQRRETLERNPGRPPDSRSADEMRRRQPEQRPDYRQAPAPSRAPAARAPEPQPRVERQDSRTQQRETRQQDQRRREIEQEHRRAEPQSGRSEKRESGGRRRE